MKLEKSKFENELKKLQAELQNVKAEFLMKEENAQLLETKTGNNDDQTYLNTPTSIGWFDIVSFVPMSAGDNM